MTDVRTCSLCMRDLRGVHAVPTMVPTSAGLLSLAPARLPVSTARSLSTCHELGLQWYLHVPSRAVGCGRPDPPCVLRASTIADEVPSLHCVCIALRVH